MEGFSDDALRALEISTLESKRELYKLQQVNDASRMVAAPVGLIAASERQYLRHSKKRNQFGKLMNNSIM